MSAEAPVSVRSWQTGPYTVTMTIPKPRPGAVLSASVEWAPAEPSRLSTEEWRQYRAGRNQALGELAAELGINVAVLEL
jgi:hypothetical protein